MNIERGFPENDLPNSEVVQIGQEFNLFTPERTQVYKLGFLAFANKIRLDTSLYELPFEIKAQWRPAYRMHGILPLTHNAGYIVDGDDYISQRRNEKLKSLRGRTTDFETDAPLHLQITLEDEINKLTLKSKLEKYKKSNEIFALKKQLDRLRFSIIIPDTQEPFESMPDSWLFNPDLANADKLVFDKFYPQIYGPMALPSEELMRQFYQRGLYLFLPESFDRIKDIKGKFEYPYIKPDTIR